MVYGLQGVQSLPCCSWWRSKISQKTWQTRIPLTSFYSIGFLIMNQHFHGTHWVHVSMLLCGLWEGDCMMVFLQPHRGATAKPITEHFISLCVHSLPSHQKTRPLFTPLTSSLQPPAFSLPCSSVPLISSLSQHSFIIVVKITPACIPTIWWFHFCSSTLWWSSTVLAKI